MDAIIFYIILIGGGINKYLVQHIFDKTDIIKDLKFYLLKNIVQKLIFCNFSYIYLYYYCVAVFIFYFSKIVFPSKPLSEASENQTVGRHKLLLHFTNAC